MIYGPDWYAGGWPSVEVACKAMLDPLFEQCSPVPTVHGWLPDKWENELPFVLVFRGGTSRVDDLIDFARVEIAAFAESRADSEWLSEFTRQMLLSYSTGAVLDAGDGSIHVTCVNPVGGQDLRPQSAFDKRATWSTFEIGLRKPLGTPDYATLRELGDLT